MIKEFPAKQIVTALLLIITVVAAPILGVVLSGGSPAAYLEFPPRPVPGDGRSFSWAAFIPVLLFVALTTWPFWKRTARAFLHYISPAGRNGPDAVDSFRFPGRSGTAAVGTFRFPGWGWSAGAGLLLCWHLIWNRYPFLEPFQRLLFFPLWLSFIILLNAIANGISGKSLLTHRPVFLMLLFPVSAGFWWSFEYLNRFVNNWHYRGIGDLSGSQYFLEATLAFSTVLPAILSIRFILLKSGVFTNHFRDFPRFKILESPKLWGFVGLCSIVGLSGTGIIPDYTYPLIWIVPGVLWIIYQRLNGKISPLIKLAAKGDMTLIWASAFAALLCGFFWEMWNVNSAAKWVYTIPGVDRFHLFEMPAAGYAGYLPFGIICALLSNSLLNLLTGRSDAEEEKFIDSEID